MIIYRLIIKCLFFIGLLHKLTFGSLNQMIPYPDMIIKNQLPFFYCHITKMV